jgi:tRNA-dihydrouridine synthase B
MTLNAKREESIFTSGLVDFLFHPMRLKEHLPPHRPLLILAPMQDVTDLAFWKVIHAYGDPDVYYTEYFRTHHDSKPERYILRSIKENPTGKPVIAQMIGEDVPSLVRTAKELQKQNIIGVDLNLGCPAPIVCKKNAGGGLLKDPEAIKRILSALREAISIDFTVKTRVGFDLPGEFDRLLDVFTTHPMNALTVHGRTVKEMYRTEIHYNRIAQAVRSMTCPVFANGNVLNVGAAKSTVELTGASGLMIGRGAIRNPWIFRQIIEFYDGGVKTHPTLRNLREYIERLFNETLIPHLPETTHVAKMKKYMNFIGPGIGKDDAFIFQIRRCTTARDFFNICDNFLLNDEPLDRDPLQVLHSVSKSSKEKEIIAGSVSNFTKLLQNSNPEG